MCPGERMTIDLPKGDDDCVEFFLREQEGTLGSELLQESNAKLTRQYSLDLLKKARSSPCCERLPPSENVFVEDNCKIKSTQVAPADTNTAMTWSPKHPYSADDIQRAKAFIKDYVKPWMKERSEIVGVNASDHTYYRYPISNDGDAPAVKEVMTETQWLPFAIAMKLSRARLKAAIECTPCAPLHMIINREGCSGKSWLIDHLVKDIRCVFREQPKNLSQRILLLAHQDTAAFSIKGQTVFSTFGFSSFSRSAFSATHTSLTTQKMAQQTKKPATAIQDVHLVIIDKFSVISCGMLHWIDERMKKIWPLQRHLPFLWARCHIYWRSGSARPAVPYALSTPLRQVYNDVQRKGRELWEAIPHVCMLTDQNRGKRDLDWFDALRRLRRRRPTTADIELINPRCCSGDCLPAEYSKAKHIAHKNVDVDTSNDERLHASNASIVPIHALHHGQQKRLHQQQEIPEGTVSALVNEAKSPQSARDRVVATKLTLCLGAPVTFTINLDQSAGLCNGTNGVIYDLIFIAGTDLPIVLVKVTGLYLRPSFLKDVPSIVLVVPREVSCGKKNSDLRVIRRGIPFATGERYSHSHGPMLIVRQGRVS